MFVFAAGIDVGALHALGSAEALRQQATEGAVYLSFYFFAADDSHRLLCLHPVAYGVYAVEHALGRSVHHALGAAPGYYAGYAGVGYGALSLFIVYSAHVVTPLCLYCGMAVRAHCKAGAEGYDDRGVRDGCSRVALGDYGVHHCVRAKSKGGAAGLVSQYGYISLGYYSLCGFGIRNKYGSYAFNLGCTVIHGLGESYGAAYCAGLYKVSHDYIHARAL